MNLILNCFFVGGNSFIFGEILGVVMVVFTVLFAPNVVRAVVLPIASGGFRDKIYKIGKRPLVITVFST